MGARHIVLGMSGTLFQNAQVSSFPVEDCDNPNGSRLGPVNDRVVGVAGQRPETKRAGCQIGTGVAAHRSFGNKRACVIDRLFHAVGGVLAVLGNVGPDVKISVLASGVRASALIV